VLSTDRPPTIQKTGSFTVDTDLSPPLKWAGGKRWLAPDLQAIWRRHAGRRLVEPFVGGMAVALGLRPRRALLNDINRHLIHFYRWLQRGLVIDVEMENDKRLYYAHRRRFNDLIRRGQDATREAAGLFYYLNRTGYNGLCRFNRKGAFNVPFGRYNTIRYKRDWRAFVPALSGWQFRSADFEHIETVPGDFIYADPPYDVEFTSYSKEDFGWEDQRRLARWLAAHPGPVVASNQATGRILDLYEALGFEIALVEGPRRISCTGDRTPAQEMLATRGI
jgi:DNA adenine methylase